MSSSAPWSCGEGGDEVSVARFIADQRTFYRVPYAVCCAILGGEPVVVLQVVQPAGHRWSAAPGRAGRGGTEDVQRVQAFLRLASCACRPARGGVDAQREHGRGLDASPGSSRAKTQAQ